MKYFAVNMLIIFLNLFLFAPLSVFSTNAEILVTTTSAQMRKMFNTYSAVGTIRTGIRKDFIATVGGTIDFISPAQGSHVKKGDVLMIIEKNIAQSTLQQAQNNYDEALVLLKRNQDLYKIKYMSLQDLENAQIQVSNTKLALDKAISVYNNMYLVAPFDGVMGAVDYVEGEYLNASSQNPESLFSLINTDSQKTISFYLPQKLINQIDTTTRAQIQYQNQHLSGKVIGKSEYISQTNGGFLLKVSIDDDCNIPDNAFVNTTFIFNQHEALSIPEEAVIKNGNSNLIYLIRDGKANAINIKIGSRVDGFIEVISDQLDNNSSIVEYGLNKLYDGASVKIIESK